MSNERPHPIRVGYIGVGLSTQTFHYPFVEALPQYESIAVLERSATAERSRGRELFGRDIHVHTTIDSFVADDTIDLAIVSSSTDAHYEQIKQCLEAGKNVLAEKPFTATSAEATDLIRISKERGRLLTVYQNRRFDHDFLTLNKLIRERPGALGLISSFESCFDRFRTEAKGEAQAWRERAIPGAGALFDLGSHLADQALQLFGLPSTVTGFVANSRSQGNASVDDSFIAHLHYPVNVNRPIALTVTLRASVYAAESPRLRFLVRGTSGTWVKYGLDVQESQLKNGILLNDKDYGIEDASNVGTLFTQTPGALSPTMEIVRSERGDYRLFFVQLADALFANDPSKLPVQPQEAAQVIVVLEHIKRSSDERRSIDLAL